MWRKEKAQLIGEINQLSMTVVGDFYFGTNTKTDPQKQNQFHAEEEEEAKPNSRCNILWERTLVVLSWSKAPLPHDLRRPLLCIGRVDADNRENTNTNII